MMATPTLLRPRLRPVALSAMTLFVALAAMIPAAQADFIGEKGHTLTHSGDWWLNEFTISGSNQTLTLYFTAQYRAVGVIARVTQRSAFTSGSAFSYIDGFDGDFGVKSITLAPGSYFVGVRNSVSGSNRFSLELEDHPPTYGDATFAQVGIQAADYVNAGGWFTHDFTIQSGFRYVIDGNNSGSLNTYIIDRTEKADFQANRAFTFYSDYGGENDPNQPGLATISLPPGNYTLAVRSTSSIREALTYRMYIYRLNSGGGGGGGSTASPGTYYYLESSNAYAYYSRLGQFELAYAYYFYYTYYATYLDTAAAGRDNLALYYFYYGQTLYYYYLYYAYGNPQGASYYYYYYTAFVFYYYYLDRENTATAARLYRLYLNYAASVF